MSKKQPSYSQLTRDVVFEAAEPLAFDKILAQVDAIRPITTKNPKNTIRGAISESQMIVATGDGRYGWKTKLIDGSVLRHTLSETELVEKVLHWDEDVRDALWPTFFAKQMYNDRSPAKVAIPNDTVSEMPLKHYGHGLWGTMATAELWAWLYIVGAQVGDHLLFRVIDSEERWYGVTFEMRAARQGAVIRERNLALVELGRKLLQRPYGAMEHDITTRALASGFYQHDVPPDPFGELWPEMIAVLDDTSENILPEHKPDSLLSALFERSAQVYDPSNPPSLPREYDPAYGYRRHARPSLKATRGSVKSWTFRVSLRAVPDVYCDIELAEDQTLEDLHLEIQSAFRWNDDHLYSFFIAPLEGGEATEVGSPWSDTLLHTHTTTIGELGLAPDRFILYLFDYGDNHEFDVEVIDLNPIAPKGKYPKILTHITKPPQQYPDYDEDDPKWD